MNIYENIANSHPKLSRNMVWCRICKRSQKVNTVNCLQKGWPRCCGYTMTIDSPDEQKKSE
jgi:hypothetical protein